jgi:hypothetical protein
MGRDRITKSFKPLEQPLRSFGGVTLREVIGAEVAVHDALADDVEHGGHHEMKAGRASVADDGHCTSQ